MRLPPRKCKCLGELKKKKSTNRFDVEDISMHILTLPELVHFLWVQPLKKTERTLPRSKPGLMAWISTPVPFIPATRLFYPFLLLPLQSISSMYVSIYLLVFLSFLLHSEPPTPLRQFSECVGSSCSRHPMPAGQTLVSSSFTIAFLYPPPFSSSFFSFQYISAPLFQCLFAHQTCFSPSFYCSIIILDIGVVFYLFPNCA